MSERRMPGDRPIVRLLNAKEIQGYAESGVGWCSEEGFANILYTLRAARAERDELRQDLEAARENLGTLCDKHRAARYWARTWKQAAKQRRAAARANAEKFIAQRNLVDHLKAGLNYWRQYAEDSDAQALEWRRQRVEAKAEVERLTALVERHREDSRS